MPNKSAPQKTIFELDNPDEELFCRLLIEIASGLWADHEKFAKAYHVDQWAEENIIDIIFNEGIPFSNGDSRFLKFREQIIAQFREKVKRFDNKLEKLKTKKRAFPYKWITSNKRVWANLTRKGNRHFCAIYQILIEGRMGCNATR